ncbi:MAG: di-trans,poly-cis-decaprenylcistransferase [Anaerolineales bacterium]|nr:di-trans,poly-cis-decaprenylcistransferase [Anaerolineales bacterium]
MNNKMADKRLKIPTHIGIIMDGNGRWAKARHLPRQAGHRAGTENLRRIIEACNDLGIRILTVFAFSTENWGRPEPEVKGLLSILDDVIERELNDLHAQGVQLRHIGILDDLSPKIQTKVRQAIELTKNNQRLILNIAWNYGGRQELVEAVKRIVRANIPPEEINEQTVDKYIFTAGLPHPDLIIRTSGEMRVSNFMIWQGAYAEYYVTPTFWPSFNREELEKAIESFNQRERRYGLVPDSE